MTRLHPKHQTLLFSATMPKEIEDLAHAYLNDPLIIKVRGGQGVGGGGGLAHAHHNDSPVIKMCGSWGGGGPSTR